MYLELNHKASFVLELLCSNSFKTLVHRVFYFHFHIIDSNIKILKMFYYSIFFIIFFLKILADYYFEQFRTRNETLFAMVFCFMFGIYIGQYSIFYFIEKKNQKILVEIETV